MTGRLLTTTEVAELLRAPVETVRYWRHRGTGPRSVKVGTRVLYAERDVEAWLDGLRQAEARA